MANIVSSRPTYTLTTTPWWKVAVITAGGLPYRWKTLFRFRPELRNSWRYSPREAGQIQPRWRNAKLRTPTVNDGGNEAQSFNKRRLACIVLADCDDGRLEQNRVIIKTPEIPHPELAKHTQALIEKEFRPLYVPRGVGRRIGNVKSASVRRSGSA